MKKPTKGPLADGIALYLAHKRSLGKELAKVEPMLHLLDGNLLTQGVAELRQITAAHIDAFVASRSRRSLCRDYVQCRSAFENHSGPSRKRFRDRAKTVRLHPGTTVRVQPGIVFVFTPERFSRSPRNPVRLAPESPN